MPTVPFDRDPDFVGRRDILMTLESRFTLQESHKRVVLAGLGRAGYAFLSYWLLCLRIYLGDRKLLSNTDIGSEFGMSRRGSSGCTQVLLRDLNKVINLLLQY